MSANSDAAATAIVAALPAYPYTSLQAWKAIEAAEEPYWGGGSAPAITHYDFSSSSGWTLENHSGTAAITGGNARLTIPSGTAPDFFGGAYNGPDIYRTSTLDPLWCTVYARLGSMPAIAALNTGLLIESSGRTYRVGMQVAGNGQAYAVDISGNANLANTSTGVMDLAGNGWVALRRRGTLLEMCYANGTGGAVPTSWTVLYVHDFGTNVIASISLFARIFASQGTDSVCAWADLYTKDEGGVIGT